MNPMNVQTAVAQSPSLLKGARNVGTVDSAKVVVSNDKKRSP